MKHIKTQLFAFVFIFLVLGNGIASVNYPPNNKSGDKSDLLAPPSIAGMVWIDTDGNGQQGGGESGLKGVTVELLNAGGMVIGTTTTVGGGTYIFQDLVPPLSFRIRFVLPVGNYAFTEPYLGLPSSDSDADQVTGETVLINLAPAQPITDIDAGIYLLSTIGDMVWHDENGNGQQNAGEPGISGAAVELNGFDGASNPVTMNEITVGGGIYQFTDVPPGNYTITFTLPAGYDEYTSDNLGNDASDSDADPATGETANINVESGDNLTTWDAGFYIFSTIGDLVWHDENANGQQNAGEPGIIGAAVELNGLDGANNPVTMNEITDGAGNFEFTDVPPGNYTITFTLPAGYDEFTFANVGGDASDSDPIPATGETANITVSSGDNLTSWDAGFYIYSNIGDLVWHDENGNGVQDGEPGIDGVTVTLSGTDGGGTAVNRNEITGGGGNYNFDEVVPGNYRLTFALPGTYDAITLQDQGGDDDEDSDPNPATAQTIFFDVVSGEDQDKWDAGMYQYVTIGDLTWEDMNGNGIQDGEPVLGGVTVTWTRASDGLTGNTVSNGAGFYQFNTLKPDTYTLDFSMAGYIITAQDATNDNDDSDADELTGQTTTYNLLSGETIDHVDAGFFRYGVIGNYCWRDQNTDGLQDGAEPPVQDVTVRLTGITGAGVPITPLTEVTDAGGIYTFTDIPPGSYTVEFIEPPTFNITTRQVGADPTIDSDGPFSDPIDLESGMVDGSIDCGFYVEPPADCDDDTYPNCETAAQNVLCNIYEINEFCTNMQPQFTNYGPICGQSGSAYQNPSWFAFMAASSTVTLIIHATNCVVSPPFDLGVQYAIYTDCTEDEWVVCAALPCLTPGDLTVTSSNFEPGNVYYLVIDGCNSTQCTYWIEIVEGGGSYQITDPTGISNLEFPDNQICVGVPVTFTLEGTDDADSYIWTLDGTEVGSTDENTISMTFDTPGTYQFCGQGTSPCDDSAVECIPITVYELPDQVLDPESVCENILEDGYTPDLWEGPPITAPGSYEIPLVNASGCLYDQTIEITALPLETAEVDTFACVGDLVDYFGNVFTDDILGQIITIPNGSANGCDKLVDFQLTYLDVEFFNMVGPECIGNQQFVLRLEDLILKPTDMSSVAVQWSVGGTPIGPLLTTSPYSITVTDEGLYTATVLLSKNGISCDVSLETTIQIDFDELLPTTPVPIGWILEYCNNTGETLQYSVFPNPLNQYQWTYPADVAFAEFNPLDGILYIDWTGSNGGQVCVRATNSCGVSDWYCQNVVINSGPSANFVLPDTICISDPALIQYTGSATAEATYTWNFSGGLDTSGSNDLGAGPYNIAWSQPGEKQVTLHVIETNGCESVLVTDSIFVEPALADPVISCSSNQTQIVFSWFDVPNSDGYNVQLVSGASGTVNGNTYTVTGLNPLDEVSIIVFALSDGLCPTTSDTITCAALDCPAVTLNIMAADTSVCFVPGMAPFILGHSINSPGNGTTTWSGPGITNPTTGLFDPNIAGTGSHQIVLRYFLDNCTFNDQAVINIFTVPTSTFTVSEDTICNDQSLIVNYTGNAPGGNPTWSFSNPTTITGSGLGQHTLMWNQSGLKNITLQVEQNGCFSSVYQETVFVEQRLADLNISCGATSTESVTFNWPTDPALSSYQIYINGTLVANQFTGSWTVNGLTQGQQVNINVIGMNPGVCPDPVGSGSCIAQDCPVFSVAFTHTTTQVCLTTNVQPVQFVAQVTGTTTTGTSTWSGPGVNPATGLFNPATAGVGTHTITYRYAEGNCDIVRTFTITVLAQPTASYSISTDRICITDKVRVTLNNYNSAFTYDWNTSGATVQIVSPTVFDLSWNTPGTYNLSLIVSNGICVTTPLNQSVVVEGTLVAPTITCGQALTDRINLQWNDVDCSARYEIYVNGAFHSQTTGTSVSITGLNPDQVINVEVRVISECLCPGVSSTTTCRTAPCESIELTITGLPASHCISNIPSSITLSPAIIGTTGGNIQWSGPGISNNGIINTSSLTPGQYTYTVSYNLVNCNYTYTDRLTIHPAVAFTVQATDPACNGQTDGSLTIGVSSGVQPYSITVNGNVADRLTIPGMAPGNYAVTLVDANGCQSVGSATINNPPQILPQISGDEVLQEEKTGVYTVSFGSVPADASYLWFIENGDTLCQGANCTTVNLNITEQTVICVEVSYNGGLCKESDCFTVRFEEIVDVYIPNIFSPNGDGENDVFYIKSDNSVGVIKSMNIFDRWGEQVFGGVNLRTNDQSSGWDGRLNGNYVLPGVYVYDIIILTVENKELQYSGDITVLR